MTARPLIDWLLREFAADDVAGLLEGLAAKLSEVGIEIARISSNVMVAHPELQGKGIIWRRGEPAEVNDISYAFAASQPVEQSPVRQVILGLVNEIRIRPTDNTPYPGVAELFENGVTDYLIMPLVRNASPESAPKVSGSTRRNFISFATESVGGLTDEQLSMLRELIPALALRLELAASVYATRGLLQVYLGRNAAERVLSGQFLRGGGEIINAVIWYCDLRGFTQLVDGADVREVIPVLDGYFDCVATPVIEAGGEILKFVGDAVLAIFPVVAQSPEAPARAALSSAVAALEAVAALSLTREKRGLSPLRIGVALHVGEVMYGNIGASNRLDFTVIGPAVNEVSRVEPLCKELGVPLLFTERIARASVEKVVSMGRHSLRGVSTATELFTLDAITRRPTVK